MGRGHGGSRGGGGANGFQGDASMRGYSSGLAKAMVDRETEIRGSQKEHLSFFDEQGNELFRNDKGTGGSVSFLGQGRLSENAIVTHNHPSTGKNKGSERSDGGGSLSKTDIMNAHELNQKEIRAVTTHRTYSLKRPAEGWHKGGWQDGKFYENPKLSYKKAKAKVDKQFKDYVSRFSGAERVAAHHRAFSVYWHQVNKEFARRQGYEYSSIRVN